MKIQYFNQALLIIFNIILCMITYKNISLYLGHEYTVRILITSLLVCINCAISSILVCIKNDFFYIHSISHTTIAGCALGFILGIPIFLSQIILSSIFAIFISVSKQIKRNTNTASINNVILALGIYFLSKHNEYINPVLKGNILSVTVQGAQLISFVSITNIILFLMFSKTMIFISTNPELRNINIAKSLLLESIYYISLGINIVAGCQIIGSLLIYGLISYPGAIGFACSNSYGDAIINSICCSCFSLCTGMLTSLMFDIPLSCCIIITLFIIQIFYNFILNK